jgi:seryl-tRNA synthetase
MLDIKFIRENTDLVKDAVRKKYVEADIDKLIVTDDMRRTLQRAVEEKRAEHNEATGKISQVQGEARDRLIDEMKEFKVELQKSEEKLKEIMHDWQGLMLQVPNIPDVSVPEGESDEDNKEIKSWGEKPEFTFDSKSHVDIMTKLDMVDFERGVKVHGFRGYFLKNDGVRLSWAVWNYAQKFFIERGLDPMMVPTIVRKSNLFGTGHLPSDVEDIYNTQDDGYLIGTSEIPTMGYYRREAGSHGKDTKGLIRVHEFYKLEQVIICEANHEESVKWHEWLQKNVEEFIESLGIPYRTVINCAGDLGQGQVKKYDVELWVPLEEKYREISSASYFHDFQTRRFNIRYKDEDGKFKYAHSLNCTAIPTPRILVSIVENFQKENGSVTVPEALRPYIGKDSINPKS